MKDMLPLCYPELVMLDGARTGDTPAWVQRYDKWGGIPRYAFGVLDVAPQATLDSAVTSINLHRLADVLYAADIEDDALASHRLFHLKPRGEGPDGTFTGGRLRDSYVLHRTELGSPYIRRAVYKAMQISLSNRLMTLLAQPIKGTSLAKF
jgi:hypothetical protein